MPIFNNTSFGFLLIEIRLFYLPQREMNKEWPSPFEVRGKVLRKQFVLFELGLTPNHPILGFASLYRIYSIYMTMTFNI